MTTADPTPPQPPTSPNRVTVVDFDMPFTSMIGFMLKWAIASIPALLILIAIGATTTALVSGVVAGVARVASIADVNPFDEWHRRCDESQSSADQNTAVAIKCKHDFDALAAAQARGR